MKCLYFFFFLLFNLSIQARSPVVNETKSEEMRATLAGGCFWCMESPFEKLDGVYSVTSGYMGGHQKNPSYKDVTDGKSGHVESVQIIYDSKKVNFIDLLDIFWRNIDPTQRNGQFNDHGPQYRTVIFYHNEKQKFLAENSKKELEKNKIFDKPIVTAIEQAGVFYPAEGYHQDYYKKNPLRYKMYRTMSGRDRFIKKVWEGHEARSTTGQCGQVTKIQEPASSDEVSQCRSEELRDSKKTQKPNAGSSEKHESSHQTLDLKRYKKY